MHKDENEFNISSKKTSYPDLYSSDKTLSQLEKSLDILRGLTRDFHTIWIVNFADLSIRLFRSTNENSIREAVDINDSYGNYEQVTNQYIENFVDPKGRAYMYQMLSEKKVKAQLKENSIYSFNFKRIGASGNTEWHQMTFASTDSNHPDLECVLGVRNINEMMRLEHGQLIKDKRLKQYSQDIDSLFCIHEVLGYGSWSMKFNRHYKITSCKWSEQFRNMLGFKDSKDFPDMFSSWCTLIHKDDALDVMTSFWDAVYNYDDNNIYDAEYRMYTKDNGIRWFHSTGRVSRKKDGTPISFVGLLDDITQRKLNEERLAKLYKEKENELHVLKSMADMYFSMHLIDLNDDSVIEYSDNNLLKPYMDYSLGATKIMKNIMKSIIPLEYQEEILKFTDLSTLSKRMVGKKSISDEFVGIYTGWFLATFSVVDIDEDGYAERVIFTTQIIDTRKKKEEELFKRSTTDFMTGLFNRRVFEEDLDYYRTHPLEDDFVLISMDVNRLKYINDNYGHAAGDELLIGAATCMREILSSYGKLYRIGGDEFVVTLRVDEKLRKQLENQFNERVNNWSGELVSELSISYGVVTPMEAGYDIDVMVKLADKKMYASKSQFYKDKKIDRRGS
ncbi:diguanylate cyclase (GGDEF) domain-containing protein [Acetitomaculum ruminis DSM 5522]|uniref:Diguanylate cyclase (GGDEF) domain-containing protein n=1 Tax=Acetitomaculum ruminis DSM 5522 TaxID=1120918 RepID=A0A1I0X7L8_9FIRM|nr:diguanylate cyclase [Acetitomaculum ruminis]SFA96854.1 diguanylate cyclase (GGDEF) domain-containing protein [Acetitomaculum ruminis DSM 5522]